MKYKVKTAQKANGEEGDLTPTGTLLYLIGELIVPDAVRKEGVEAGLKDTDKMYLAYDKEKNTPILMTSWKVENISEELVELEIEDLEYHLQELSKIGLQTY